VFGGCKCRRIYRNLKKNLIKYGCFWMCLTLPRSRLLNSTLLLFTCWGVWTPQNTPLITALPARRSLYGRRPHMRTEPPQWHCRWSLRCQRWTVWIWRSSYVSTVDDFIRAGLNVYSWRAGWTTLPASLNRSSGTWPVNAWTKAVKGDFPEQPLITAESSRQGVRHPLESVRRIFSP